MKSGDLGKATLPKFLGKPKAKKAKGKAKGRKK